LRDHDVGEVPIQRRTLSAPKNTMMALQMPVPNLLLLLLLQQLFPTVADAEDTGITISGNAQPCCGPGVF